MSVRVEFLATIGFALSIVGTRGIEEGTQRTNNASLSGVAARTIELSARRAFQTPPSEVDLSADYQIGASYQQKLTELGYYPKLKEAEIKKAQAIGLTASSSMIFSSGLMTIAWVAYKLLSQTKADQPNKPQDPANQVMPS